MEQGLPLKGHCGWIRGPYWYDDMGMVASGGFDNGGYCFLSFLLIVSSFPEDCGFESRRRCAQSFQRL